MWPSSILAVSIASVVVASSTAGGFQRINVISLNRLFGLWFCSGGIISSIIDYFLILGRRLVVTSFHDERARVWPSTHRTGGRRRCSTSIQQSARGAAVLYQSAWFTFLL